MINFEHTTNTVDTAHEKSLRHDCVAWLNEHKNWNGLHIVYSLHFEKPVDGFRFYAAESLADTELMTDSVLKKFVSKITALHGDCTFGVMHSHN